MHVRQMSVRVKLVGSDSVPNLLTSLSCVLRFCLSIQANTHMYVRFACGQADLLYLMGPSMASLPLNKIEMSKKISS